jgi:hypothetical protein
MLSYAEIDEPVFQKPTDFNMPQHIQRPVMRRLHLDGIHFIIIYIFALFFMALTVNK